MCEDARTYKPYTKAIFHQHATSAIKVVEPEKKEAYA
jgi:hypothetical protein